MAMAAVKYHAYLRKMTRYNPTRGGKSDIWPLLWLQMRCQLGDT